MGFYEKKGVLKIFEKISKSTLSDIHTTNDTSPAAITIIISNYTLEIVFT